MAHTITKPDRTGNTGGAQPGTPTRPGIAATPATPGTARKWLWFGGLYFGGIVVLGGASLVLRVLLGTP